MPKSKVQSAHDRNRLRRIIRNSFDELKNESVDLVFLLAKNLDQSKDIVKIVTVNIVVVE